MVGSSGDAREMEISGMGEMARGMVVGNDRSDTTNDGDEQRTKLMDGRRVRRPAPVQFAQRSHRRDGRAQES